MDANDKYPSPSFHCTVIWIYKERWSRVLSYPVYSWRLLIVNMIVLRISGNLEKALKTPQLPLELPLLIEMALNIVSGMM